MPHPLIGREIVVPASTSNLGPGFDAVGLALQLYLRLRVVAADDARAAPVAWRFLDSPAYPGGTLRGENYLARGVRALAGGDGATRPALTVEASSDIPVRAGLGSSAAAIVAGLRLYEAVAGHCPTDDLLAAAAALEGHPDNTSSALLGGFVVSCLTAGGRVVALGAPWPEELAVVVATPALELETRRAREALPAAVPFGDAIANVQRAALLVQALHEVDRVRQRAALGEALRDRLHQPYREPLVPGLREALALRLPSLVGIFLSGAGPSVAAIADGADGAAAVADALERLYAGLGVPVSVRPLRAHQPR